MKKYLIILACLALMLPLGAAAAFADDETTGTEQATVTIETSTDTAGDQSTTAEEVAGVTPDSLIYPIERLIESIQVAVTFNADEKAVLLVEFANERLAEAEIMTAENKLDLVEKVMNIYVDTVKKANEQVEEASQDEQDVTAVLEKIELIEDTADKVVIKATGVIPQEMADGLQQAVYAEVKKTLAVKAFATAKQSFYDAKKAFEAAKAELKVAQESGDEAAIAAALAKLQQAEEYKDQMEQMKDEVEELKEQIKEELEEGKDASEKAAKIEEQLKKHEARIQRQLEKVQEQSDKKEAKIEARPNQSDEKKQQLLEKNHKQTEKKTQRLDKELKKQQDKAQDKMMRISNNDNGDDDEDEGDND